MCHSTTLSVFSLSFCYVATTNETFTNEKMFFSLHSAHAHSEMRYAYTVHDAVTAAMKIMDDGGDGDGGGADAKQNETKRKIIEIFLFDWGCYRVTAHTSHRPDSNFPSICSQCMINIHINIIYGICLFPFRSLVSFFSIISTIGIPLVRLPRSAAEREREREGENKHIDSRDSDKHGIGKWNRTRASCAHTNKNNNFHRCAIVWAGAAVTIMWRWGEMKLS